MAISTAIKLSSSIVFPVYKIARISARLNGNPTVWCLPLRNRRGAAPPSVLLEVVPWVGLELLQQLPTQTHRALLQPLFRLERRPVTFEGEKLIDTAHRE